MRLARSQNLDVMVIQGRYAGQKNGLVPCSDMAGEVIAVGDEVKTWKAGDRVCANLSLNHLQGPFTEEYKASFSGFLVDGVLAEYKTFPGHVCYSCTLMSDALYSPFPKSR